MSNVTVITDNVPRDILDGFELTPAERGEFDYLDWSAIEAGEDSASFVRYRGDVIDLGDLEVPGSYVPAGSEWLHEWNAYKSETFFSGILVRYVEGFERVIVGRYFA